MHGFTVIVYYGNISNMIQITQHILLFIKMVYTLYKYIIKQIMELRHTAAGCYMATCIQKQ